MTTGNGAASYEGLIGRLYHGVANATILDAPQAEAPNEGDEVIVVCDDFLKRYYSYHQQLVADNMPLQDELNRLADEVMAAANGRLDGAGDNLIDKIEALAHLGSPDIKAKVARMDELKKQLEPLGEYCNWVGRNFWREARARCPALREHPSIGLRSDWTIVALPEERGGSLAAMLARAFGGEDGGMKVSALRL